MKKYSIRSFGAGFLCAVVLLAGIFTAAAVTGTIDMNRINLSMNGQSVFSEGEFLELESGIQIPSSLSYVDESGGGTTYLPLAYISKLLNVEVTWYGEHRAVVLGENKTAVLDTDILMKELAEEWLVDGEYPKNSKGETYGPDILIDITGHGPDLSLAQGIGENGERLDGYVRPEELQTPQDIPEGGEGFIPLYDSEGTVIGTFRIANG